MKRFWKNVVDTIANPLTGRILWNLLVRTVIDFCYLLMIVWLITSMNGDYSAKPLNFIKLFFITLFIKLFFTTALNK